HSKDGHEGDGRLQRGPVHYGHHVAPLHAQSGQTVSEAVASLLHLAERVRGGRVVLGHNCQSPRVRSCSSTQATPKLNRSGIFMVAKSTSLHSSSKLDARCRNGARTTTSLINPLRRPALDPIVDPS